MIERTWRCLNHRCEREFVSYERAPECPHCSCVRVEWVPMKVNTSNVMAGVDAEFRKLTDTYGMTDMASARRDERAMPPLRTPEVDQRSAPAHVFAPGFACVPHARQSVCVPSVQPLTHTVKAGIGVGLAPVRSNVGRMQGSTRIEATHRPKP